MLQVNMKCAIGTSVDCLTASVDHHIHHQMLNIFPREALPVCVTRFHVCCLLLFVTHIHFQMLAIFSGDMLPDP